MMQEIISRITSGEDLVPDQAYQVMRSIMTGSATPAQVGAFLAAMRLKGESFQELLACARVMQEYVVPIPAVAGSNRLVDTCGTGGDGTGSFNISTASALVTAGAGVPVVKHGNRGVSSRCGSADVMKALGVTIEITPVHATKVLQRAGMVFLYAPLYHPAMSGVAGVRRELGIRTIFNLLGPLSNPAGAGVRLLGVYDPALTEKIALVLSELGVYRAMVVHGDGMDEISTTGPTRVTELDNGAVRTYILHCEDFGIPPAVKSDLLGGSPDENAGIIRRVLEGAASPARDIILLNAGAAIYLGGKSATLTDGIRCAARSVDSGRARAVLDSLIRYTGENDDT
jgi:anthranilate phosphoribosyltransferase